MRSPELRKQECHNHPLLGGSANKQQARSAQGEKSTEIITVISANAIRHSHCSEPPDEILNVEAIYTALGDGKNGVGVVGNAAVPGKVSFLCPKKQQSERPI